MTRKTHIEQEQAESPNKLISVRRVAELLGVVPSSVHRYEKEGRLPSAQLTPGGQRRWRLSDIQKVVSGLMSETKLDK